jgi:glutamine amidotransferase
VSGGTVVLVDSGGANIGSVRAALARLGVDAPLTTDAAEIRRASHVILPGVGAAANAMARLRDTGLDRVIRALRQPVLGVCVGMQILYERCEEGDTAGLCVLPGVVRRLDPARCGRVPHMGWNQLAQRRRSPLLDGWSDGAYAYFVHGYAADADEHALATCDYGGPIAAVVQRGNFFGAQFHPERSAGAGARLIERFLALAA